MKKYIVMMIAVIFVNAFLFGDLVQDFSELVENTNQQIMEHQLKWESGMKEGFLNRYKDNYESVETLMEQLNGSYKIPAEVKQSRFEEQNSRMTTTWESFFSSLRLIKPEQQPEKSFYRLEPVRNQYYYGSCWAFSAVGSFESAYTLQVLNNPLEEANINNDVDFSERWAGYHNVDGDILRASDYSAYQDQDRLNGGWGFFALYNGIRYGMLDEKSAPYSQVFMIVMEQIPLPVSAYGAARIQSSKTVVIPEAGADGGYIQGLGYSYDEYINMIKTALKHYGSLAVRYNVPGGFPSYSKGIYSPSQISSLGGHAVTLVGWAAAEDLDDIVLSAKTNQEASPILEEAITGYTYFDLFSQTSKTTDLFWIIKNSWGYDWGDGGYYVVPAISQEEYNNPEQIREWQIEYDWMFVPLFDDATKHEGDELDINADGKIDEDDFKTLIEMIGLTDMVIGDLAYPKDGKITNEDIGAWINLYNH